MTKAPRLTVFVIRHSSFFPVDLHVVHHGVARDGEAQHASAPRHRQIAHRPAYRSIESAGEGRRYATSIIARGKLLSGDLIHDRLVVTELAAESKNDRPGPFGDPQLNQMALPNEPAARTVPMRDVGTTGE